MKFLVEKWVVKDWLTTLVPKLFPDKACISHLLVIRINTSTLRIHLLDPSIGAFHGDLADLHRSKLAVSLHEASVA